jgi:hypothetical protein
VLPKKKKKKNQNKWVKKHNTGKGHP